MEGPKIHHKYEIKYNNKTTLYEQIDQNFSYAEWHKIYKTQYIHTDTMHNINKTLCRDPSDHISYI